MSNVSYVVLQPHSLTNPSDSYRVVEFREWANEADGIGKGLPVRAEVGSYGEAEAIRDGLNESHGA